MKMAVSHDWLETYAGAERVLEQILKLYPEAIIQAVEEFEMREQDIKPSSCRQQAEKFTEELFRARLQNHIETVLNSAHGNEQT